MNIKNIFFDFDGVIAESVSAKTEAFEEMYLPYGKDIAAKVVDYHKLHGGVSRYEKFKYFHKEFLNEVINQEKVNELAIQFSNLVLVIVFFNLKLIFVPPSLSQPIDSKSFLVALVFKLISL